MRDFAPDYEAMVNVAGVGREPLEASLADDGELLFEEYERVRKSDMYSSLLLAHLATHHLTADGYLLFNSNLPAFNMAQTIGNRNQRQTVLQKIVKAANLKQGLDLSLNRTDE